MPSRQRECRGWRESGIVYRPSPNLVQRVHAAHRIAAVVAVLREDGVPASQTLSGADLKVSDLKAGTTRVSYKQIETVFRNAIQLSKDPAIAFRAGQKIHVMTYGLYGYALLSSPTRAEGIDFTTKYSRALGAIADVVFSRDEDTATYTLEPLLSRNPNDDVYRFAMEFAFAALLSLCRDVYGRSFDFLRLRATYAAPASTHVRIYKRMFPCPISFDQPRNELEFNAGWIDHPLVRPDPITHVMAAKICEQFLGEVGQQGGVAADIRRALLAHPGRFPSIEAMAAGMSIHPRTLRRRLEAEQITYRDVVAEVRMKLAVEYLRNTRMTNDEIAARLDYSDAANFRHAFARWTGRSPSDFRAG